MDYWQKVIVFLYFNNWEELDCQFVVYLCAFYYIFSFALHLIILLLCFLLKACATNCSPPCENSGVWKKENGLFC